MAERLEAWAKKAKNVGVYDYWAVYNWSNAMPGMMLGGNVNYLTKVIPEYYRLGARVWISEAGNCWGPCGLGYYLASRLLWNTAASSNKGAIINDFLNKSFGKGALPMKRFYELIDGSRHLHPALDADKLEETSKAMYSCLRKAWKSESNPKIRERLKDLLCYTRLVELRIPLIRLYVKYRGKPKKGKYYNDPGYPMVLLPYMIWGERIRWRSMAHYHFQEQMTALAKKLKYHKVTKNKLGKLTKEQAERFMRGEPIPIAPVSAEEFTHLLQETAK